MSAASSTFTTVTVATSSTGTCTPSSMSSTVTSMTTTSISQTSTSSASSTTSATPPAGSVFVTFIEQATVSSGQAIYVVGSIPQLANWAPANAIAMAPSPSPTWIVRTTLPANTYFEYKFVKKTSSGSVQWESDPNRNYRTPASGSVTLTSSFK
ncbi:hypothetical protein EWM64_g1621 [Hericium alpestre]|uniref:CBM20 domain-containing protein n=1 Tax=Hericium alpestre TaxID=135208 RepID=A0A4Z0A7Z3_9AGAM|nr:hypothetical protein EWM64_g1621 [Hericium alpestre]